MSWCFYVLRCSDESLYAGSTNAMARRFASHNAGEGARYTSGRRPVSIEMVEPHADRSGAQRAEAAFKKLSRAEKERRLAEPSEEVFLVRRAGELDLDAGWEDARWSGTLTRSIERWREESGPFRPATELKLAWDQGGLRGIFRVEDEEVRALETLPNSPVYRDSCVELFLLPPGGKGYFNFEWNAGGTMLAGFVTDPARNPDGSVRGQTFLEPGRAALVDVQSSLGLAPFEVTGRAAWTLSFRIPFDLLGLKGVEGETFLGNFYKCGDRTVSPHWGSWRPLTAKNFHQPESFGFLCLVG